jgi:hypothetical protein
MGRKMIITSSGAASAMLVAESSPESVAKRPHDIGTGHGLPAETFKLVSAVV